VIQDGTITSTRRGSDLQLGCLGRRMTLEVVWLNNRMNSGETLFIFGQDYT